MEVEPATAVLTVSSAGIVRIFKPWFMAVILAIDFGWDELDHIVTYFLSIQL